MTRLHKKPNITQEKQDTAQKLYKEERARLKTAILRAKQSKWKRVIEEVEESPWVLGYKIVMNKLSLTAIPALSEELMLEEAKKLFPQHGKIKWATTEIRENIPPLTAEELDQVARNIKLKKAAGQHTTVRAVAQRL